MNTIALRVALILITFNFHKAFAETPEDAVTRELPGWTIY